MGGVLALQALQVVGPLLGFFELVTSVAALFAPGFFTGWMQARTFPYALDLHRRWALATALGGAAAPFLTVLVASITALGDAASVLAAAPWTLLLIIAVLGGATVGAIVGACQAVVLHDYSKHSRRWVLASAAGGLLATTSTVWGLGSLPPLVLVLCMLVIYAVVTGFVFPSLLTPPRT